MQLFTRKRLNQAKAGWKCRRLFPTLGVFVVEKIEGLAITTDGKMFVSTDNDGVDDSSKRSSGQSARSIQHAFNTNWERTQREKSWVCLSNSSHQKSLSGGLSGSNPSISIPKERFIYTRIALISFKDFRPKFFI